MGLQGLPGFGCRAGRQDEGRSPLSATTGSTPSPTGSPTIAAILKRSSASAVARFLGDFSIGRAAREHLAGVPRRPEVGSKVGWNARIWSFEVEREAESARGTLSLFWISSLPRPCARPTRSGKTSWNGCSGSTRSLARVSGASAKLVALYTDGRVAQRILDHHGLSTSPPTLAPACSAPEPALAWSMALLGRLAGGDFRCRAADRSSAGT